LTSNNVPIKILVLNSDHDLHDSLKSVLMPEKFSIRRFHYQAHDINNLQNYDPDVIILYFIQLKSDGIPVCQEIRNFSKVPILVIANISKPGMLEKILDAGADEYLIRPISDNLLLAHINTLARRAKAEKRARKLLFGEVQQRRDTKPQFV